MKTKRIMALLLALAGLVSLSAFGTQPAEALADAPQNENSGEMTWVASFTDVTMPEGAEYLQLTSLTGDGFYSFSGEMVANNEENGSEPSETYESRILFVGFDGKASLLENYKSLVPEKDRTGKYNYSVTASPQYLFPLQSGDLAVIESVSESWVTRDGLTSDDEEYWLYYDYNQEYWFRLLNTDGSEKLSRQIQIEEDQYLYSAAPDREGNIVCLSGNRLLVISPEGELLRTIETGYYFDSLIALTGGNIFATAWGESGVDLYPVDTQKGEVGRGRKLPNGAYTLYPGGGKYPLYYSNGSSLCGYDPESGEGVKLFSWLGTNVSAEMYGAAASMSTAAACERQTAPNRDPEDSIKRAISFRSPFSRIFPSRPGKMTPASASPETKASRREASSG